MKLGCVFSLCLHRFSPGTLVVMGGKLLGDPILALRVDVSVKIVY